MTLYRYFLKTKIGELQIASFNKTICCIDYRYRAKRQTIDKRIINGLQSSFTDGYDETIETTINQIDEYLAGQRKVFDLPIKLVGTPFQQAVWNELLKIPYGETQSYHELATSLGDTKAIRAVAAANGANTIAMVIPCHRIIGSNGELTGYAGGLEAKRFLLELEQGDSPHQPSLF